MAFARDLDDALVKQSIIPSCMQGDDSKFCGSVYISYRYDCDENCCYTPGQQLDPLGFNVFAAIGHEKVSSYTQENLDGAAYEQLVRSSPTYSLENGLARTEQERRRSEKQRRANERRLPCCCVM